ncbi:dynamin family protein [Clostridium sp.]|uniref:dynamin family protein n=1 Tax=Clostridium sp. TaxID=1506 RepID=UPI003D6CEA51
MDNINYIELFSKITTDSNNTGLSAELIKLKDLIDNDIVNFLKQDSPINSAQLYFDFKYQYERLVEHTRFMDINGKKIIALGGSFSSGKSTFVNTLLKKSLLPAEITATTSVPTYIISGDNNVQAINIFNSQIKLTEKELKMLTHDSDENDVNFGHLLRSIFVQTKELGFQNIGFLDTPGYSKYDDANYSDRTDEKIARAQLNSADYIFWFVKVDDGTITGSDIEFLKTLNPEIPKSLIISKCDKLNTENLKQVFIEISSKIKSLGLNIENIFCFSRAKPERFDIVKINQLIERLNIPKAEKNFAEEFIAIFKSVEKYYDDLLQDCRRQFNRLNIAMTKSEDEQVIDCLNSLHRDYKLSIKKYSDKVNDLKRIWSEFSSVLKVEKKSELKFTMENQNVFSKMVGTFSSSENCYANIVKNRRE